MQDEIKGIIKELFDLTSGIILGEDQNEYYFWKVDFLEEIELKKEIKVKFKPEQYITNKEKIYKAVLISKDEEEVI